MTETDKIDWWKTEDAAALKQARTSTDMSREDFARQLCISKKQLIELEDGGSSAFYSEQIKYQTGAKILGYFDILTVREEEAKESAVAAKLLAESQNKQTIAQLDSVIETNKRDLAPETHREKSVFQIRNGYVLGAVLVIAAILGVMYAPEMQKGREASAIAASTPAIKPPLESTSAPVSEATTELPPLAPVLQKPEEARVAAEQATLTCNWDGTPMPLKPIAADRPADRIHLIANTDLQLCLKDGAGQVRVIKLQAGDRQTFYGSGAPWYIYSPQMVYLKVFFQGYHVFIPKEDTQFVKVNAHF
jgi:transcriptional regulator with XRE-family HTH domain